MGFDRWRGGKGEDPEAANRRDNDVNVLVRRAFGNPKKTGWSQALVDVRGGGCEFRVACG